MQPDWVAMPNAAAQPFLLGDGPIGMLLIHGWLGLPGDLRPLADYLAQCGYTVSGPLLARHGARPDGLHDVRWEDWAASVEAAHREITTHCTSIVLLGYSLGGLLALHLASQRHVAGVITLAAALAPARAWLLRALVLGRYFMPWLYPMRGANFADPQLRAELVSKLGHVDFDDPTVVAQLRTGIRISTRSIYEVVRLAQRVRRLLPLVTSPALIMQGRLDTTVQPISAQHIYNLIGTTDKELAWFERSGHLLPNDLEHEQVSASIASWLDRHHTSFGVNSRATPSNMKQAQS